MKSTRHQNSRNLSTYFTPWYIFAWTIAIGTTVIGVLFWKMDETNKRMAAVEQSVVIIQTDVGWIRNALNGGQLTQK